MTGADRPIGRRAVLRALAGAGAGAGAASLAGCSALDPGEDGTTTEPGPDRSRELAEAFAPALYFDANERWFPTDPRPYASDRDGEAVVDGFEALDGYAARYDDPASPPDPTVFHHAVEYRDSPLAVVQYWLYSAFDQFTTNFHWHDWEVLHAFVDTDTGEPQLYVASSHSRTVPNNEFLDPEPGRVPRVLSELGSHSSALSSNDLLARFQRVATGGEIADITNSALEGIERVAEIPVAYGLPRDEGGRLPYLVPELDGRPIYEDDRLPSVDRADLIDDALTVRSYDALASPPTDLPGRETGLVFRHADRDPPATTAGAGASADVAYELVPAAEIEDIGAFTGPQLSFEFAVPAFAEDAIASHVTTASAPWAQPRYANPAADISDPVHRATLADRYAAIAEPGPINRVVATVTRTVTAEDAPAGEGVTTTASPVEAVALLESEPAAIPTFGGVAVAGGVPDGDHRLTVNRAGAAPHAETVRVSGGTVAAGVGGEIPLVDRESATKLEVDARGTERELTGLAVADDFGGRLYDAPLSGPDAVYVDRRGAYTTEVRDAGGEVGAFRVTPADEARVRIEEPDTGKAVLSRYVADVAEETRAQVAAVAGGAGGDGDGGGSGGGGERTPDGSPTPQGGGSGGGRGAGGVTSTGTDDGLEGAENAVRGLATALAAIASAAERAAERAAAGDRGGANARLDAVASRLSRASERLAAARGNLPEGLGNATARRLGQAERRASQARAADRL